MGQAGHDRLSTRAANRGGSDSVYSFFDVSGFKAGFGRKLFTDIDIRLVVNSDIQLKNARLSRPNTRFLDT
jgi:hypothetical protein